MSWAERLKSAEPYLIGLGLPLVLCLLAIIFPVQFMQQSAISILTTKVDEMDKKMDLRVAFLDKNADLRADNISKKIEDLGKKMEGYETQIKSFEDRISSIEVDPKKLLERLGIAPDATFTAVSVQNDLYVLPRTSESKDRMTTMGYEMRQIAPMITGFAVQPSRATPSRGLSPFPNPIR